MKIGEWQDEKPTEAGVYFALFGDVEVPSNLYYAEVKEGRNGLYTSSSSSLEICDEPLTKLSDSFQWAKVYVGKESK